MNDRWDEEDDESGRRQDPDRPRHRGRFSDERDDYDENFGYFDPRKKVQGPGLALLILGWLGSILSIGMVVLGALFPAITANGPPPPDPDEPIILAIVFVGTGIVSLAANIVLILGGSRMRQCRNWGLAMTAAILAIASFMLVSLCGLILAPFGIWALVVLVNSDVKKEFTRQSRRRHSLNPDDGE